MKKIAVITATRAEYGLLKPVITSLIETKQFEVSVVVTGAHLSAAFGNTVSEIEKDGIPIAARIPILDDSDSSVGVSKTMANAIAAFSEYFHAERPDMAVLLGDRYETLAIAAAAFNERIPIAHLYGGETTEGAVDEAFRHAITKMSYLHFTSTAEYRKRVIQLGEHPSRVFNVGAIGIENALHVKLLSKAELEKRLGVSLGGECASVTFHPVTLEGDTAEQQVTELLEALIKYTDIKFVISKANADAGGRAINAVIDKYAAKYGNLAAFESLGAVGYLSLLKTSSFVIGNSSSGLVEAPSFGIPIVNIGDRQRGRLQAESVINCAPCKSDIIAAIDKARSSDFKKLASAVVNPYGDGNTSGKITAAIKALFEGGKLSLKKKFYDIDFEVK